ncbi:unnamed protein product [Lepidochelys kempii]
MVGVRDDPGAARQQECRRTALYRFFPSAAALYIHGWCSPPVARLRQVFQSSSVGGAPKSLKTTGVDHPQSEIDPATHERMVRRKVCIIILLINEPTDKQLFFRRNPILYKGGEEKGEAEKCMEFPSHQG